MGNGCELPPVERAKGLSPLRCANKSNEGKEIMSVDLAQMNRIHDLENEIDHAQMELKAIKERRTELVTELPEFTALETAQAAVKEAAVKLKLAIQDNRELNALHVEQGEVRYLLHDLKEMLSHHLVAYHDDTGRDVVRDREARNRHIELSARLSKPGKRVLDQERLPLGLSRHFGAKVEIPEAPTSKQLELIQENK